MIREGFQVPWTTQVRADFARDTELVGLMKKAGCHTVYIGFESVNPLRQEIPAVLDSVSYPDAPARFGVL